MKRTLIGLAVLVTSIGVVCAQDGTRAWQQRLHIGVDLPVPILELNPANPFSSEVDTLPVLRSAVPPRKLEISGIAEVAVYVDAKGYCQGTVPLSSPFPGVPQALVGECSSSRYEPARSGKTARPSWVVLKIGLSGKVKESTILNQKISLPDPSTPPEPVSRVMTYSAGQAGQLPASSHAELTSLASPKRLSARIPSREITVPINALVHVTKEGRCDSFVPLEVDSGFHSWLSAFLATWQLEPATRNGSAVDCWIVVTARSQMNMGTLEQAGFKVLANQEYDPHATGAAVAE